MSNKTDKIRRKMSTNTIRGRNISLLHKEIFASLKHSPILSPTHSSHR